ncbi:MAG: SPASM domain-containing protein [Desulfovibrio sp.]|jgi:MoaA/NifB/PqqE/SkfB family radical SAM enzyme|nr:SPASM domain-containing protein [Desulfovibrio sp.]
MAMPSTFAVETVLGCNLRCRECAVGANLVKRKYGHMKFEQFRIIAEKIRPYCKYLYLHLWGEPMINPDILAMLRLASEFTKTNISTNANTLDDNLAKDLIRSGVSDIIVSIDGVTQRTYSTYRKRGDINKALLGLTRLVHHNIRYGNHTAIMPQFIVFDHNKHEMELFRDLCNTIGLNPVFKAPYIRRDSLLKDSGIEQYKRNISRNISIRRHNMKSCNIHNSFVILLDGSTVPCCYDHNGDIVFGNIYTHNIDDICNTDQYINFINAVLNGNSPEFCINNCLLF